MFSCRKRLNLGVALLIAGAAKVDGAFLGLQDELPVCPASGSHFVSKSFALLHDDPGSEAPIGHSLMQYTLKRLRAANGLPKSSASPLHAMKGNVLTSHHLHVAAEPPRSAAGGHRSNGSLPRNNSGHRDRGTPHASWDPVGSAFMGEMLSAVGGHEQFRSARRLLGMSKTAWIVLAICVVGCAFCAGAGLTQILRRPSEEMLLEHAVVDKAPQGVPWYLWPVLLSIDTIAYFSSDAYLPNILQIQEGFNTSTTMVTLTLQLNWIVMAFAVTIVGVLADRYGRKLVLMACFGLFAVASVLAATSTSIYTFLAARVVMAVGQSSYVMASVIARDLIDDEMARLRTMGFLASLQPVVIVTAPIVGGAIGSSVGWRWVFWLQAAWGAMAGLGCTMISEPKEIASTDGRLRDAQDGGVQSLYATACKLFTSREYLGSVGLFGIMFGAISAMLTLLPFTLEGYYDLGEAVTGDLVGCVAGFLMAGGAVAMLISELLMPLTILRLVGLALSALGCADLLLSHFYTKFGAMGIPASAWWPMLVPCFLMVAMQGILNPACQTLCLTAFKDMAGAAAGGLGFVQTLMMAAGSALASAAWDGTPRSFYATLGVLVLGAQLWFWLTLGLYPPSSVAKEPPEVKEAAVSVSAS